MHGKCLLLEQTTDITVAVEIVSCEEQSSCDTVKYDQHESIHTHTYVDPIYDWMPGNALFTVYFCHCWSWRASVWEKETENLWLTLKTELKSQFIEAFLTAWHYRILLSIGNHQVIQQLYFELLTYIPLVTYTIFVFGGCHCVRVCCLTAFVLAFFVVFRWDNDHKL